MVNQQTNQPVYYSACLISHHVTENSSDYPLSSEIC